MQIEAALWTVYAQAVYIYFIFPVKNDKNFFTGVVDIITEYNYFLNAKRRINYSCSTQVQ
jgi:hypothetical protein